MPHVCLVLSSLLVSAARTCPHTHVHTHSHADPLMAWLFLLNIFGNAAGFYPVLHPLPFGAQIHSHTHTLTHTRACVCTYTYSPEPHYDMASPVFTCMGLCCLSRVVSLIVSSHTCTRTYTHTSEPKGFSLLHALDSVHVQICPPQPPKLTHTKTQVHIYARVHTHTHARTHTPAPGSSQQHGFSCYMCLLCCMSSPLSPCPGHTACWSCCNSGNQLVWSCSSVCRRDCTYQ